MSDGVMPRPNESSAVQVAPQKLPYTQWSMPAHTAVDLELQNCSPKTFVGSIQRLSSIV